MKRQTFVLFAFALFLLGGKSFAQQTDCPRIYKQNDTLRTDPAPSYQWYKNGVKIPNAVQNWFRPDISGNYSVAVGGTSAAKSVTLNPVDLRVEVFDAKLKPVTNAAVTVNGQTTTTDGAGRAFLPNVVSGRTVIKVTKSGFFDGFTSVYKLANGSALARLQLSALPASFTFQDTSARMVAAPSGLSITFPKNGFVVESTGAPYSGAVTVYFEHRAPENDALFSFAMPGGDFTGVDAAGETVALTSYGFFHAELRGANGEKLNLAPNKPAEVTFRIPEAMRANAPATVPLWSFGESFGNWKYDSELSRNGVFYKGEVSHFSSWNCDFGGPACTVVATAKDCNGNPAINASVCLNSRCGVTDSLGNITFINAPANIPLTLSSAQDTINIDAVGQGDTYTLAQPILGGENMLAFAEYWQDSVAALTFGAEPPVEYSLNGQDWQSEPLFTGVPFQDSVVVWIKDVSGCPIKRAPIYARDKQKTNCVAAENQSQVNQFSTTFDNLPNWNGPLYGLSGCPMNAELFAWALGQYNCLDSIFIQGCALQELPKEIGNLSALKTITLNNNLISALPAEIVNLSTLAALILNKNEFTSIPPEIGSLSGLLRLEMGVNHLTSISPEIGNLTALLRLQLDYNQLTSLPPEIGNLAAIQELELYDNQLTSLPPEIANLADTLQRLYLQNNPIPVGDRPYYQSLLPNTQITWE